MNLAVRLSAYWFLIMGALGVFFPFFTLYLRENAGLSSSQVGMVAAAMPLTAIFFQPFWGQVADRTGSRTRTLALLALGTAAGYALLTVPLSFAGLLAAASFLAVFSSSLIPMGISVSLAALEETRIAGFGRVRVWGTIGYLCTVVTMPRLLHWFQRGAGLVPRPGGPSEPALGLIFFAAGLLVVLGSFVAWRLPRTGSVSLRASRRDYRLLLRHLPYLRVLAFAFLSFLFIQGPMMLFPIYVRSRGGDMNSVSAMWVWMLLLEIPLVAQAGPLFRRIGPRVMVASGAIAGGLRWLVCALSHDFNVIYPAQLLHAVVVAGLLIGAPLYVEVLIPSRLRSTGQGLLMTLGMSIGGILSMTLCGALMDRFGADFPYLIGGLGAVAVGCAAPLILPPVPAENEG
jgi:PPP family 3-phenylpropionic acid transporter